MFRFLTLVVVLGFYLLCNLTSQKAFAHSQVQVIEMTSNGFEPQEVSVDTNQSVIFINKDSVLRWPASNIHPTHELYPQLDPKRPIAPGESWAFKPTKTGEWKFHDHLYPHYRGVLSVVSEEEDQVLEQSEPASEVAQSNESVVEKVRNFVSSIFAKIRNVFNSKSTTQTKINLPNAESFKKFSYEQQEEELRRIGKSQGSSKAWEYIRTTFKGEGGSTGAIHDLAHLSGLLLYEEKGFENIKNCTADFAFGCYHGFLDKAFTKDLSQLSNAYEACLKLGTSTSGPAASCIHGIGHGVASFHSTINLEKALADCRKLEGGNQYCFDGVFMEFVRNAQDTFFNAQNPYYPCDNLEEKFGYAYSFECGRNQPSLLMGRFKMGFSEVIGVCSNSSSKPFKEGCFDSLGFSLAGTGDVNQIISGCSQIGIEEYISKCIKASAGELVFQEIPGWYEKSKEVCSGFLQTQSECLENVNRLIREYNKKVTFNFRNLQVNEDPASYAREQLKVCYDLGGRDSCYKESADALYKNLGLSKNLEIFKTNEGYPQVYARCHEVTHYLSRLEYEKQGSISKVYSQCDSTCHGGCYHGTIEAYLKEQESKKKFNLTAQFPKVCGSEQDYQKPIEYNECFHGLGHAAMFVTEMELMDSLLLCDTIEDQKLKERCFTGVFMENSSSSTSFDHKSKFIKADDPFYPCNALSEKYQPICWQYQSSYFAIISDQNWQKVAQLCLKVPEKYQDRCFRTIGTNQVGFTASLTTMKNDCGLMPSSRFKDICISGVVSSLAYRFVGDMGKMIDFCLMVDPNNRESCFKQIGYGILDWDKNKEIVRNNCQKIPDPQGLSWCMSSLGQL